MRNQMIATIALILFNISATTSASAAEPEVYFFGATGCDYCDSALAFLKTVQSENHSRHLHAYDIVDNSDHATLFVRITDAIGLLDPVVPMTIVGSNIILGYKNDETSGVEIRMAIEQCREWACPDIVRPFIDFEFQVAAQQKQNWTIDRRYANSAKSAQQETVIDPAQKAPSTP
jgi:thiol-disulfide isomerase/thioredoxin